MARNGGAKFDIPDEILSVIPDDPFDQLDLARRITSMAITSRVSQLEAEAGRLRRKVADRDRIIDDLQEKLARLDRLVQESDSRLRSTLLKNAQLSKERDVLATTSKKLSRDLSKLETFKKHLMRSLSYDNLAQLSETDDVGTYKQPIARVTSWNDEGAVSHFDLDVTNGSGEFGDSSEDGSTHSISQFPSTTRSTAEPLHRSLSASPALRIPHRGEHASGLPLPGLSRRSSPPSSPPRLPGPSPRMDGKELFRQARTQLSYEQFAAFLATVKEFNAQRQSRQETLDKAEEIFGDKNKDLYLSFHNLLNRNL